MEETKKRQAVKEALEALEKNRYVFTEETVRMGHETYKACQELDYKEGMAFSLLVLGRVYCYLNDYQNAMSFSFDAINLAQELNICDLQVLAYINIGSIFFDMDDFEKSLDYYNAALRIMDIFQHSRNYLYEYKAKYFLSKIYNNIGEVHRLHELYQEASRCYELAYEYDKEDEFQGTFGVIQINLGYVECYLEHYEKALEYMKDALKYLEKYNYAIGLVEAYAVLALVYRKLNDQIHAEESFDKALSYSSVIEYAYAKVDLYIQYSEFLEENERYQEAVTMLLTAYQLCEESNLYSQSMEVCRCLIRFYEKMNLEREAFTYYRLYFDNQRKQEPIKKMNKTKRFEMKLKFDKLELEKKDILEKSEQFRKETKELSETISNISAISEMGSKLTTSSELPTIYQMLWNAISEFMEPNVFGIGLFDEETGFISYPFYMENNIPIKFRNTNIQEEASMAAKALREKKIIILDDLQNEYLSYLEDEEYISKSNCYEINAVLFCPLVIDQQRIGVMTVQSYEKNYFTIHRIEAVKAYASYAAIAINHAIKSKRLIDEVEKRKYLQAQLESSNEQLSYLSEHDALTGLPNKRKFDLVMSQSWERAVQRNEYLAVAIFDIDFFKQYNDYYGHIEGDRCLYIVGNLVKKTGGHELFLSRFGGDEFVMIFSGQSPKKVYEKCEEIRRAVEEKAIPHQKSFIESVVTITMGIHILIPVEENLIQDCISEADHALYKAKEKGRNRIEMNGYPYLKETENEL
ncbi:MAG: diguanylate cyclase [Lachnospiraceae bacterium]|nr:diguanylate cyclase [Lachnospiraceae bacterium]